MVAELGLKKFGYNDHRENVLLGPTNKTFQLSRSLKGFNDGPNVLGGPTDKL